MRKYSIMTAALLAGLISPPLHAQPSSAIPGVVAADAKVELVGEYFKNTEGPLGDADGNLYFSDTEANRTYLLDRQSHVTMQRESTNRGNGIAFTRNGDMLWAEGDGPRISTLNKINGGYRNLMPGTRLFQPNDLIADDKGGIYFTDPGPRPVVPGLKVYVYYLPPGANKPIVIDDSVPRPNGVTLTNNGRTLYVDNTIGDEVFAYDVQPDGSVKNRRVFAKLRDIPSGMEGVGDGMGIDRQDRLYVTSLVGVQIFDPSGKYLGTIKVPRQPSNVAFAGADKKTLYITARQGLYRINMLSQGPVRLGK
jgi:gluconolactonase